jgi:hypothetical protein
MPSQWPLAVDCNRITPQKILAAAGIESVLAGGPYDNWISTP